MRARLGRGRRAAAGAAVLIAWSLVISVPATSAYGRQSSPAFLALQEAARVRDRADGQRVIGLHAVARRAVDWLEAARESSPAPSRPEGAARPRVAGADRAVAKRSRIEDLVRRRSPAHRSRAHRSRVKATSARISLGVRRPPYVGGARPGEPTCMRIAPPGWLLEHGWALTAEVAGVTRSDGWGPHRRPSVGWIRARPDAAMLMIGGRHLGRGERSARAHCRVAGRRRARRIRSDARASFFASCLLPAGSLAGARIRSARGDSRSPRMARTA